jgi:hypothetical protein
VHQRAGVACFKFGTIRDAICIFGVASYWSGSSAYSCCSSVTVVLLLCACTHNTEICGCPRKDSYKKTQCDVIMSDILNREMLNSHLRASLAHGMSSVCVAVWTFRHCVTNVQCERFWGSSRAVMACTASSFGQECLMSCNFMVNLECPTTK